MIDLLPNLTFIPMVGLFFYVLFVLNHFVFKPTRALMDERENQTDRLKDLAAKLLEETHQKAKTYEQKTAEARTRAALLREEIVKKARREEHRLIDEARKQNDQVLRELQADLGQQKKEATLRLRQYAQDLARNMVNKILEKKVA